LRFSAAFFSKQNQLAPAAVILSFGRSGRERPVKVSGDSLSTGNAMANTILVGAQWGDEGKGKIIDVLTGKRHRRPQPGRNNAGHTVIQGGKNTSCISFRPAFCGAARSASSAMAL
jgi:hypothetical protein